MRNTYGAGFARSCAMGLLLLAGAAAHAQDCPATVTDVDGNEYAVVRIGGQCWMAGNLRVGHYRTGWPIMSGLTDFEWVHTRIGAFLDVSNWSPGYGKLYNWYAVADPRGICPEGWHVASSDEWNTLIDEFGGEEVAADALRSLEGWMPPDPNATNASGFSAVPAGWRFWGHGGNGGGYSSGGIAAYFWSSTATSSIHAWSYMLNRTSRVHAYDEDNGFFSHAMSCRCVKNSPVSIEAHAGLSSMRVFPNPAQERIFIEWEHALPAEVQLFNTLGAKVLSTTITSPLSEIGVASLPPGMYVMHLTGSGTVLTAPLVKE